MKILFIGDIVGRAGRGILKDAFRYLNLRSKYDFIIANAENAAGGFGITNKVLDELLQLQIDCFTMGNHTFDKKEAEQVLLNDRVIRPANLPPGVVGAGYGIFNSRSGKVAVVNLLGRIFMQPVDCPFRSFDSLYNLMKRESNVIIVDFHAEATSEKNALGYYLDGRASAVIGTHTHVPTDDCKILPNKTAYVTDVGMTGSSAGIIGFKKDSIIQKFLTCIPKKFEVDFEEPQLQAVAVEIDEATGMARSIERVFYPGKNCCEKES
ncbi:TIGR00282 family metallophosphoesterase [Thermodesulfobium sp.]